jgi:uncharacterized membrane protein
VLVVAGLILHSIAPDSAFPNYRVFAGDRTDLRNIRGIWQDTLELRGRGLIQLGLILLLATPIARVVLSMLAFACQRDRVYVLVTIIVLAVLGYSVAGSQL